MCQAATQSLRIIGNAAALSRDQFVLKGPPPHGGELLSVAFLLTTPLTWCFVWTGSRVSALLAPHCSV